MGRQGEFGMGITWSNPISTDGREVVYKEDNSALGHAEKKYEI